MKDAKKRNLKAGTLAPICSPSIKWTKESGSRWVQRPPTQHSVFLASLTAQCYPVFKRETETERGGRLWRRGRNKLRKMDAGRLRKNSAQDWPGRRKQQSVQPAIYGPHVTQNIYECVPAQNKPWVHMQNKRICDWFSLVTHLQALQLLSLNCVDDNIEHR